MDPTAVRPALSEPTITLSVRGLGKRFGDRIALRDVAFDVRSGERLAVIGPNGAGKTTLLSILAGVQSPSEGGVTRPARSVGWVPQQLGLYSKLSVSENLRLFARLEGMDDTEAAVQRMLAQTGLAERADEVVGRLSGGNRQRINIAVGLLSEPSVLLLDEPSSSLDPRQRERLWEFVAGLAGRGTSVVYSTHNVGEAERYADRVLVLVDGELLFTGTPGELHREAGSRGGLARPDEAGLDFEAAFVAFLHRHGH